ncbi:MAG TPA: hypothetical protein V6D07_19005 [Trichocoleus sp.]
MSTQSMANAAYAIAQQSQNARLTGTQDGLGVGIIYRPDPKKFQGMVGFSAPNPQGEGESGQLEIDQLFLHEGTQFVATERWDRFIGFERNKPLIKRLERLRILTILIPEAEKGASPTGTTVDYPEQDDALMLVENSFDREWLRACFAAEIKRPEVKQACQSRINYVTAQENNRNKQ